MRVLTFDYHSTSCAQQLSIQVQLRKQELTHLTCTYISKSKKFTTEIWQPTFFEAYRLSLRGTGPTGRLQQCLQILSDENRAILQREYSSDDLEQAYYRGLSAYLTWLLLLEQHSDLFPDVINIPTTLESGQVCNRNLYQYLQLYSTALSSIQQDVCSKLLREVHRFFKCWDDFFYDGPIIPVHEYTRLCMQIVSLCTEQTVKLQQEQLSIMRNYTLQLENNLGIFMLEHSTSPIQQMLQEQQKQITKLQHQLQELDQHESSVDLVADIPRSRPIQPIQTVKPTLDDVTQLLKPMEILLKDLPDNSEYEPQIRDEQKISANPSANPSENPAINIMPNITENVARKVTKERQKKGPKETKTWTRQGVAKGISRKPQVFSHATETVHLSQEQPAYIDRSEEFIPSRADIRHWQSNFSHPSEVPKEKPVKVKATAKVVKPFVDTSSKSVKTSPKFVDSSPNSRKVGNSGQKFSRFNVPTISRPVERIPFQRRRFTSFRP